MQARTSISDTPLMPSPDMRPALTPHETLIQDWPARVGLEDVATLEVLLDEAVQHLANVLKLLPSRYNKAEEAREFLAQFRQPV